MKQLATLERMMFNQIDPNNDNAGTVGSTGDLRTVLSQCFSKKTPGIVPCAARLVGALLACTVLLPVSVSGQGIGGSPDFRPVLGPYAVGLGDCDGDNECEAGLVCRNDVAAVIDVCEFRMVGDGDFCTVNGPCPVGESDCDSNQKCEDELVCQNNVGADYRFSANIDVCAAPPLQDLGNNYFCTLAGPCGAGEGDCDVHHECQAVLVCHNNVGESHGFVSFTDVCGPPVLGSTNYCTALERVGKVKAIATATMIVRSAWHVGTI